MAKNNNTIYKPSYPFKNYEEEANFWDTHSVLKEWSDEEIAVELVKDRKKEEVLHVKVEPALKEAVSRKAKKESRTVSNAVRKVLIDWVKDK